VQLALSQEVTQHNGATAFCPCTHIRENWQSHSSYQEYARSELCTGELRASSANQVGDIAIYDSRIIHWGGGNKAEKLREIISYSYCHEWFFGEKKLLSV